MGERQEKEATERLAASLREAWLDSGLTLREVANRSEWFTSPAYLSRAPRGRQTLSLDALKEVAEAFGRDYRRLLAEAGLDEETYKSRHAKKRTPIGRGLSEEPIRD